MTFEVCCTSKLNSPYFRKRLDMKYIITIVALLISISCCAQNNTRQSSTVEVLSSIICKDSLDRVTWSYDDVDVTPVFQNYKTLFSFHKWVDANIYYPEDQPDAIGWVIADFDIMPDGTLSNVVITKGLCESIDRVQREVLLKSPKWKPGRKNNQPCITRISGFRTKWMLR